ncbi:MAG TPA: rRNA maturation RNase YbeY [Actinomycetota bacterium]|nr:rRNA maturation RNase YbeY [Actinomycetota bacterium]
MDDDPHLGEDWPRVLSSNRQNDRAISDEELRTLARDTLRAEGVVGPAELSLSFVDAEEIAELHERFMDESGPTDVLSFPLDELDEEGVRLLGDVVVAPGEAARNNPDEPDAEIRLLVVHGILHILGYDHEEDVARTRMWDRQERYSGVRAP